MLKSISQITLGSTYDIMPKGYTATPTDIVVGMYEGIQSGDYAGRDSLNNVIVGPVQGSMDSYDHFNLSTVATSTLGTLMLGPGARFIHLGTGGNFASEIYVNGKAFGEFVTEQLSMSSGTMYLGTINASTVEIGSACRIGKFEFTDDDGLKINGVTMIGTDGKFVYPISVDSNTGSSINPNNEWTNLIGTAGVNDSRTHLWLGSNISLDGKFGEIILGNNRHGIRIEMPSIINAHNTAKIYLGTKTGQNGVGSQTEEEPATEVHIPNLVLGTMTSGCLGKDVIVENGLSLESVLDDLSKDKADNSSVQELREALTAHQNFVSLHFGTADSALKGLDERVKSLTDLFAVNVGGTLDTGGSSSGSEDTNHISLDRLISWGGIDENGNTWIGNSSIDNNIRSIDSAITFTRLKNAEGWTVASAVKSGNLMGINYEAGRHFNVNMTESDDATKLNLSTSKAVLEANTTELGRAAQSTSTNLHGNTIKIGDVSTSGTQLSSIKIYDTLIDDYIKRVVNTQGYITSAAAQTMVNTAFGDVPQLLFTRATLPSNDGAHKLGTMYSFVEGTNSPFALTYITRSTTNLQPESWNTFSIGCDPSRDTKLVGKNESFIPYIHFGATDTIHAAIANEAASLTLSTSSADLKFNKTSVAVKNEIVEVAGNLKFDGSYGLVGLNVIPSYSGGIDNSRYIIRTNTTNGVGSTYAGQISIADCENTDYRVNIGQTREIGPAGVNKKVLIEGHTIDEWVTGMMQTDLTNIGADGTGLWIGASSDLPLINANWTIKFEEKDGVKTAAHSYESINLGTGPGWVGKDAFKPNYFRVFASQSSTINSPNILLNGDVSIFGGQEVSVNAERSIDMYAPSINIGNSSNVNAVDTVKIANKTIPEWFEWYLSNQIASGGSDDSENSGLGKIEIQVPFASYSCGQTIENAHTSFLDLGICNPLGSETGGVTSWVPGIQLVNLTTGDRKSYYESASFGLNSKEIYIGGGILTNSNDDRVDSTVHIVSPNIVIGEDVYKDSIKVAGKTIPEWLEDKATKEEVQSQLTNLEAAQNAARDALQTSLENQIPDVGAALSRYVRDTHGNSENSPLVMEFGLFNKEGSDYILQATKLKLSTDPNNKEPWDTNYSNIKIGGDGQTPVSFSGNINVAGFINSPTISDVVTLDTANTPIAQSLFIGPEKSPIITAVRAGAYSNDWAALYIGTGTSSAYQASQHPEEIVIAANNNITAITPDFHVKAQSVVLDGTSSVRLNCSNVYVNEANLTNTLSQISWLGHSITGGIESNPTITHEFKMGIDASDPQSDTIHFMKVVNLSSRGTLQSTSYDYQTYSDIFIGNSKSIVIGKYQNSIDNTRIANELTILGSVMNISGSNVTLGAESLSLGNKDTQLFIQGQPLHKWFSDQVDIVRGITWGGVNSGLNNQILTIGVPRSNDSEAANKSPIAPVLEAFALSTTGSWNYNTVSLGADVHTNNIIIGTSTPNDTTGTVHISGNRINLTGKVYINGQPYKEGIDADDIVASADSYFNTSGSTTEISDTTGKYLNISGKNYSIDDFASALEIGQVTIKAPSGAGRAVTTSPSQDIILDYTTVNSLVSLSQEVPDVFPRMGTIASSADESRVIYGSGYNSSAKGLWSRWAFANDLDTKPWHYRTGNSVATKRDIKYKHVSPDSINGSVFILPSLTAWDGDLIVDRVCQEKQPLSSSAISRTYIYLGRNAVPNTTEVSSYIESNITAPNTKIFATVNEANGLYRSGAGNDRYIVDTGIAQKELEFYINGKSITRIIEDSVKELLTCEKLSIEEPQAGNTTKYGYDVVSATDADRNTVIPQVKSLLLGVSPTSEDRNNPYDLSYYANCNVRLPGTDQVYFGSKTLATILSDLSIGSASGSSTPSTGSVTWASMTDTSLTIAPSGAGVSSITLGASTTVSGTLNANTINAGNSAPGAPYSLTVTSDGVTINRPITLSSGVSSKISGKTNLIDYIHDTVDASSSGLQSMLTNYADSAVQTKLNGGSVTIGAGAQGSVTTINSETINLGTSNTNFELPKGTAYTFEDTTNGPKTQTTTSTHVISLLDIAKAILLLGTGAFSGKFTGAELLKVVNQNQKATESAETKLYNTFQ